MTQRLRRENAGPPHWLAPRMSAPLKPQKVQPRFRRKSLWRRIVTPRKVAVLGILAAIGLGVFAYFYVQYSRLLDAKLRGDVLIRTSGIYAQPKTVHVGENLSLAELRSHFDDLGYTEASAGTDPNRGHYALNGSTLTIEPGPDAVIDGQKVFPGAAVTFSKDGGSIARINELGSNKSVQAIVIEPELLTTVSNENREKRKIVSFDSLPKHLVDAVVAIEDRRFYEHRGIDYRGLARAVWVNVTNGEITQGGSTLTQQLVKNLFLTSERTYKRKLQEAFLAIVLETRLTKPEIMQLYCNEIFLGQQGMYSINGMGEASSVYFDTDVSKLELHKCALLAGIIRGPSLYSPYSNPDKALERRNQVLDAMVESGFVSAEEAAAAKALPLDVVARRVVANADAPYFVDYLQKELQTTFPGTELSSQSLRIYSTIDMDLQHAAERAVRDNLAALDKIVPDKKTKLANPDLTVQAALVALNPRTGEIYAMVGGRDYEASQLNRATDAKRQPGSVFKPVVYAAAIESAYGSAGLPEPITPVTPFLDSPEKFVTAQGDVYEPDNFGKSYSNKPLPLREGLVKSLNVVTVRVAEKVGLFQVQQVATKLGLPKPPPYLATALGTTEATPLEVAEAYTAFADLGQRCKPTGLARVTNGEGATVRALKPSLSPAIHAQTAYIVTDFLKDVLNRGTAAGARARGFSAVAAGKTGTSRDGWFAGFTPNLVCVVYVGFDNGDQLGLEGSKSALPIWTDFMKAALRYRPDLAGTEFEKPAEGLVEVDVDPESGGRATPHCLSHHLEYFVAGTEPKDPCPVHDESFDVAGPDDGSDLAVPPYKLPPGGDRPHPEKADGSDRDSDRKDKDRKDKDRKEKKPQSDRPRKVKKDEDG